MSLRIYRRDLPHLRLDGATYWVTWNLRRRQSPLRPAERAIVASTIRHFDGVQFDLHAFVVMDDHVHVVVTTTPGVALEAIVHSWKSFSAGEQCNAKYDSVHVRDCSKGLRGGFASPAQAWCIFLARITCRYRNSDTAPSG